MKIPMPVWAAFTTGRPELLVPLRGAVAKGELLTQEEQLGLLDALSEAVAQTQETTQRNQAIEAQLRNYALHIRGGEKLMSSLIQTVNGTTPA